MRCAEEQTEVSKIFFSLSERERERGQQAAQRRLSSENNGNLLCVSLHVDVLECLLMLESSVSHVEEQIIL